MVELKRCPFCGGEAELRHGNLSVVRVVLVICPKCKARTEFVWIDHPSIKASTGKLDESTRYTEQQAIDKATDAWNRRAGEKDG